MTKITRRAISLGLLGGLAAAGGGQAKERWMTKGKSRASDIRDYDKWQLSGKEWKARLSPEAYAVLRREATERPGSSPLDNEKRDGIFACAGCGFDLFKSEQKFDSGTGWPSFFDYIPGALETKNDFRMIIPRTEYHFIARAAAAIRAICSKTARRKPGCAIAIMASPWPSSRLNSARGSVTAPALRFQAFSDAGSVPQSAPPGSPRSPPGAAPTCPWAGHWQGRMPPHSASR